LKSDGSIVGWGQNYHGQASPPDGNDFVAIAAGSSHSLALRFDGSIVSWGYNDNGEFTPPDGNDYVAIAAGGSQSLALKSDGSIVSWPARFGHNPPAGNDFVAISAGLTHSLALKKDCQYELTGDLNNDCKVDFSDLALMVSHWLIDCDLNPSDPACVPKKSSSHIFLKPPGSYQSLRRSIMARIPANGNAALAR
jgi:alpha-tubulin suppressor-like RCC1 family protein